MITQINSEVNGNQSKGILDDLQDEKKEQNNKKFHEKSNFISFWRNIFFTDFMVG